MLTLGIDRRAVLGHTVLVGLSHSTEAAVVFRGNNLHGVRHGMPPKDI